MKTKSKNLTVVLCCVLLLVVMATPLAAVYANAASGGGVDFRSGIIKYALSERFSETPNTFEAVIKVETDQTGDIGNIFSNEMKERTPMVAYAVNSQGNLTVNWNSYEKNFSFDKVDLRNGRYTHVAVVRYAERGVFALYVDGKLAQEVSCGAGTDVWQFQRAHCVGGDWYADIPKRPFKGFIRQVTVYSRALPAAEVGKDYAEQGSISYRTRDNLMFNAEFSLAGIAEKYGSTVLVAKDTSMFGNDACLATNDYFFEGETFETQDYTFAVLPDLQLLNNHYQSALRYPFDYVINNAESKKIVATFATGDITDGYSNHGGVWGNQYPVVAALFERLRNEAGITYVAIPGNHDYDNECKIDHSVTLYNEVFPIDRYKQWKEWGGSFSDDSIVNSYYLATYGGVDYLVFGLDFGPSDEVLQWCCEITERYPDRRVVAITHGFLNPDSNFICPGSFAPSDYGWASNTAITINDPEDMWNKWLKKYPNIFMVVCGHVTCDDVVLREYVGDNGNVVGCFLLNMQAVLQNEALEGLVGLFGFDERNMQCYINYASSIQRSNSGNNKLYNYQNQYVWDFSQNTNIVSKTYFPSGVKNGIKSVSRADVLRQVVSKGEIATNADNNATNVAAVAFVCVAAVIVAAATVYFVAVKRRLK